MSFKISNVSFEQSIRSTYSAIEKKPVENVSTNATLNPYIDTTLAVGGNYQLILPDATPGTQKIITMVSNPGENIIAINFHNGYNGNTQTHNLYTVNDMIIFYATSVGWQLRTYID